MGSAGNYILDELIKQINLLRKENERLTKENLELQEKSSSSFAEVLKQGNQKKKDPRLRGPERFDIRGEVTPLLFMQ